LPKNNLADNTTIYNNANIYFDFNSGIETNSVFHTIKENLFNITSSIPTSYQKTYAIKAYPNPFKDIVMLELSSKENNINMYKLDVFDVQGKLILSNYFNNKIELNTNTWNQNLYLYNISLNNTIIVSGKLIRQ
jgi:hypothetical protein